ncbi:MAG: hypothetical protein DRI94_13845 [Bacteroidetes bacterium]|nr:MAG: hypothetical protein DRI94_13845 [Bacteroidota bacterium]
MLQYKAVDKTTLGLIKAIQSVPEFKALKLVGGTNLALQIGHRKSVDIDLFGKLELDSSFIVKKLKKIGNLKVISLSKTINIFFLNNIKVDIVNYPYKWLNNPIISDRIKLASLNDIAAMKLSAITNRGSKKDFIDIYFLLKKLSLKQMLLLYLQKYSEGNEFLVLKSLGYFDDAESEPMPFMFEKTEWSEVKNKIKQTVSEY